MKKVSIIWFIISLLAIFAWCTILMVYAAVTGHSSMMPRWLQFGFCITFISTFVSFVIYCYCIRKAIKSEFNNFLKSI